MSWESTLSYYRAINQGVRERLGELHSAKLCLWSVDFAPLERLQHEGKWEEIAALLSDAARRLERAGGECLVLCTNTMHKVAPQLEQAISIPLLHIADATGEVLVARGIRRVGLLGTQFTMEEGFYKNRLRDQQGVEVVVPELAEQALVHQVIYEELCRGIVSKESRSAYLRVIESLSRRGAEGVILGCTEIALLVQPDQTSVPLFDTTALHAHAAVEFSLREEAGGP